MPQLGKKYTCYSCHTKFYDLGKPVPLCPKCGADQRDAEEHPVSAPSRSRRAPVEPVEEPELVPEAETPAEPAEEEEEATFPDREGEEEEEDEDEEEEEY